METVGNGRKQSETVGKVRKRSETWSGQNLSNPRFFKISISGQRSFFWRSLRCPRGNGWKQSEIAPSLGKKKLLFCSACKMLENFVVKNMFFGERKCDLPFPLGHLWTFKKKLRWPEILILKNCGLDKFWPDHVSDRFRTFPTVSDCFRPFPTVSIFLND